MREFLSLQERVMLAYLGRLSSERFPARLQPPLIQKIDSSAQTYAVEAPEDSVAPASVNPSVIDAPSTLLQEFLPPLSPPLLAEAATPARNLVSEGLRKSINLQSDPYLNDHRLDGSPVLPFACAAEYLAEAAEVFDKRAVRALSNIRMLSGVVLVEDRAEIELAIETAENSDLGLIRLDLCEPNPRPSYRAEAEFGAPLPPPIELMSFLDAPAPLDPAAMYRDWLFHGPCFRTITEIGTMGRERIAAKAASTTPVAFGLAAYNDAWTFDPGIVDGALQLIFAWTRLHRGAGCLPTAIGRIERYGDAPLSGEYSVNIEMLAGWTDAYLRAQCEVVDSDGFVRMKLDNIEGWMHTGFVRLSGQPASASS